MNQPQYNAPAASQRIILAPLSHPEPIASGSDVKQGGFSGLAFDSLDSASGQFTFWTHTDRGPNGESTKQNNQSRRPFLMPEFQPEWLQVRFDSINKSLEVIKTVKLTTPNKQPMTGLPNVEELKNRLGDEVPVDSQGDVLALDLMGVDPEGLCIDEEKNFWMVEEYRPSILKFNSSGQLLKRYVPVGSYSVREIQKIDQDSGQDLVMQVLPKILRERKLNRGFEGVACLNKKIYAILQSPLPSDGDQIRMIEFDPVNEEVSRELFYPLEDAKLADKIGDLATDGESLYAIEQNGEIGRNSIHQIFKLALPSVKSTEAKIKKSFWLDLTKEGFDFAEKIEGLAVLSGTGTFVINDNDFDVSHLLSKESKRKSVPSVMGFIPAEAPPSR